MGKFISPSSSFKFVDDDDDTIEVSTLGLGRRRAHIKMQGGQIVALSKSELTEFAARLTSIANDMQ